MLLGHTCSHEPEPGDQLHTCVSKKNETRKVKPCNIMLLKGHSVQTIPPGTQLHAACSNKKHKRSQAASSCYTMLVTSLSVLGHALSTHESAATPFALLVRISGECESGIPAAQSVSAKHVWISVAQFSTAHWQSEGLVVL